MPLTSHGHPDDFPEDFSVPENTGTSKVPVAAKTSWYRSKLLWFALGGTGVAVTGTYVTKPLPPSTFDTRMADTGLTFSKRSVDLVTVQVDALKRREAFARKYTETGDLADVEHVALETEWISYLRSTAEPAVSYEQFRDTVYEPHMAKVAESFAAIQANANPDREDVVTGRFTDFKEAVQSNFKENAAYERSHNSVVDPLTNGDVQCRSGTKLFLLAALRHDKELLLNGERLVQIHTKGHTLPGILTADGQLIGFEMTKTGKGITEFGTLADIEASGMELQVIDAGHGMAEDAIGATPHKKESVLLDTVKPATRVGGGGFGFPDMRPNTDQHGFGKAEVSAGRKPLDRADYISPRAMEGESGIYGNMDVPSASADLMGRLTPQEQIVVRRYMQHTSYFTAVFDKHVAILREIENRPTMTEQEVLATLKRADVIVDEVTAYIEKNSLAKDHRETERILDAHGLQLSIDVVSILRQMGSNHQVVMWNWAKANPSE